MSMGLNSQLHAPAGLPTEKDPPVVTEEVEDECEPEKVWTVPGRAVPVCATGNRAQSVHRATELNRRPGPLMATGVQDIIPLQRVVWTAHTHTHHTHAPTHSHARTHHTLTSTRLAKMRLADRSTRTSASCICLTVELPAGTATLFYLAIAGPLSLQNLAVRWTPVCCTIHV